MPEMTNWNLDHGRQGRVLSWAPDIDHKTMEQAQKSSALPFVQPHVALMPDAHFGYGATVGSVIPTQGAIIPSAVGVDIGCGMIASRLNCSVWKRDGGYVRPMTADDLPDDLTALHGRIAKAIPAGVGQGHDGTGRRRGGDIPALPTLDHWNAKLVAKAATQFGSLGSGNHFVEVCLDENDHVWIVLHSGSRGVGNQLATMHIDGAKKKMAEYFISLPDPDLAYLVENTREFDNYITDMLWAQDYAYRSRQAMMFDALQAMNATVGLGIVTATETINCHHNFTERENHMGKNMWITRKGAIRARAGDRGVIPGSMGAETFIVRGKGNPASFLSCSHGAGRTMSRAAAKRAFDMDSLVGKMAGITWNESEGLLDEHPDSYKDIHQVMANQADLVTIEHTLTQVLNYKGA